MSNVDENKVLEEAAQLLRDHVEIHGDPDKRLCKAYRKIIEAITGVTSEDQREAARAIIRSWQATRSHD
jgi:hypothetical protein